VKVFPPKLARDNPPKKNFMTLVLARNGGKSFTLLPLLFWVVGSYSITQKCVFICFIIIFRKMYNQCPTTPMPKFIKSNAKQRDLSILEAPVKSICLIDWLLTFFNVKRAPNPLLK
jgi:hypothetical protein